MSSDIEDFSQWLNGKLRELNTDESIFGSYINGILEGDETIEEKREALEGILSEIIVSTQCVWIRNNFWENDLLKLSWIRFSARQSLTWAFSIVCNFQESDIEAVIRDILDKWQKCQPSQIQEIKQIEDVDTKLAKLLENKHIATVAPRQYTPEELRIREQILSQYSQVEFDDEYEAEDDTGTAAAAAAAKESSDPMMAKNTNALDVQLLAKERREQARLDSKAKKDKDKEDREKQKQMREEKKEKRKTVKGEKRR